MTTKDTVFIALFAALTAALAILPPVNVPVINVPITAQTFGVMLAGGVLGARRGALSMILFLALVAVGLPFLSGGRGGAGVFMGPSGGFLFGWVLAAFAIGYMVEKSWQKLNFVSAITSCVVGGIIVLYAVGIPWIAVVAGISIDKAALSAIAYIPGDLVKAGLAAIIMVQVKRSYPLISVKA